MATKRWKASDVSSSTWSNFSGGLRLGITPENIEDNELAIAENLSYWSNGQATGSPGLDQQIDIQQLGNITVAESNILEIWYMEVNHGPPPLNKLLEEIFFNVHNDWLIHGCKFKIMGSALSKIKIIGLGANRLFRWDLFPSPIGQIHNCGNMNGDLPTHADWHDTFLTASGKDPNGLDHLQYYDLVDKMLKDVKGSPDCDIVIVKNGRVIVALTGSDRVYTSAYGDYTNWTHDIEDPSSAQWFDVDYNDGQRIVAMSMLNDDLLVFKNDDSTQFKISRVQWSYDGNSGYEGVTVKALTQQYGCFTQYAVEEWGNRTYFLGWSGMDALETDMSYGEIKILPVGRKVNETLSQWIDDVDHIYRNPVYDEVWCITQQKDANTIAYVYHYLMDCWTTRSFPAGWGLCEGLAYNTTNNEVWTCFKGSMFKFICDPRMHTSQNFDKGWGVEHHIDTTIQTKRYLLPRQPLLLSADILQQTYPGHTPEMMAGTIQIGDETPKDFELPVMYDSQYYYNHKVLKNRRTRYVDATVKVTAGKFSVEGVSAIVGQIGK